MGACRPRGVSVRVCRRVLTGGLPGSAPAVPRPSVPRPSPALRGFCRSRGSTVAGRFSLRLPPRPSSRLPRARYGRRVPALPDAAAGEEGGKGRGKEGGKKGVLPSCGGGVGGGSGASVVGPARRSRCSLVRRGASARARTGAGPPRSGGVPGRSRLPFARPARPRSPSPPARASPAPFPGRRRSPAPLYSLPPSLSRSLSLSLPPPAASRLRSRSLPG